MLTLDSRLLMYNGKYKSGHQLRIGDTFVSSQGQHHNIVAMETVFAPCVTVRTSNWYAPTNVIYTNEVLDHKHVWKRPHMVSSLAVVPMKNIISVARYKLHKVSNKPEIGMFLGRFLAAGGFNEDDDTPYIMTGKDKQNEIDVYQNAYPYNTYTSTSTSTLIYLDKSLQSMLCDLMTSPELFILANADKTTLLMSIRKGLTTALRDNLNMNLEPRLLEIVYLLDHLVAHTHKHVTRPSSKFVTQKCLYLDTDTTDDNITFVMNNLIMRRKLT
jgi:hypothetical protein